jgi:membrane protease YdiL (CAAX protease family)
MAGSETSVGAPGAMESAAPAAEGRQPGPPPLDAQPLDAQPFDAKPWGLWASLGWYVLIFEIEGRAYDFILKASGLEAVLERNYLLHSLNNIVAWGVNLVIIVLAVRLTRIPLSDYLGWVRPRTRDVALAVAVVSAAYGAFVLFLIYAGGAAAAVDDYRAAIAAGTSPWWFVLQAWPTLILSPFVEETFFRGFLWRGVQFRYGNGAAFLVTTLLFAAMHYNYWMPGGVLDPASVVQYLVASAVFGWMRWTSGGTVAPMIAHALDNAGLKISQIVLSAVVP